MTICLGKRSSFGLMCVSFMNFINLCSSFPFSFDGGLWNLIVLIPDPYQPGLHEAFKVLCRPGMHSPCFFFGALLQCMAQMLTRHTFSSPIRCMIKWGPSKVLPTQLKLSYLCSELYLLIISGASVMVAA